MATRGQAPMTSTATSPDAKEVVEMARDAGYSDEAAFFADIEQAKHKASVIDKYLPANRHKRQQLHQSMSWPFLISDDWVTHDLESEFDELCQEMPSPVDWTLLKGAEWCDLCADLREPYFSRRWHLFGHGFGRYVARIPAPVRNYTQEREDYEILLREHRRRINDWVKRFDAHQNAMQVRERRQRCKQRLAALKGTAHSKRKRPV